MRRSKDADRPLITAAEERDREDYARRRLCAERCQAVEDALTAIGFARDTSYWSVALLVARVCDGWAPLVRSLDRLASDDAIATSAKRLADRKRIVRRALDELQAFGVLTYERSQGAARRRTRPEVLFTIRLNRAAIVGDVPMEPVARDADNEADRPRTTGRTTGRTDPGQRGGQTENHTVLSSLNPKTLGPLSPGEDLDQERLDQKCSKVSSGSRVTDRRSTEATAHRLCASLGWPSGNVRTLWQVAAAFDAGFIAEHAIADAVRASRLMSRRQPIGYFRTVLAERLATDSDGLSRLLRRVVMHDGWPTAPPSRVSGAAANLRRVEPPTRVCANDVRNSMLDQLEAL